MKPRMRGEARLSDPDYWLLCYWLSNPIPPALTERVFQETQA